MDVLTSGADEARRRPGPAAAVGAALLLLAAGQVAALTRTPPLPDGVSLEVPLELYSFTESRGAGTQTVTFQLRNTGREVRVDLVSQAVPGLALVDRVVAGEPVGFREVGLGPQDDVPPFVLGSGLTVVVSLTFVRDGCSGTPTGPLPVDVAVTVDGTSGVVPLSLPTLPDDAEGASPDDVVEWQQVLVRRLC